MGGGREGGGRGSFWYKMNFLQQLNGRHTTKMFCVREREMIIGHTHMHMYMYTHTLTHTHTHTHTHESYRVQ